MVKIFESKHLTSWIANSYLLYDDSNCILVDPSYKDENVENFIKSHNLNLLSVILTHGHFDHITGVDYFVEKYKCSFMIHKNDIKMLTDPIFNSSFLINEQIICNNRPKLIEKETIIKGLDSDIEVIHTPFHTPGGICLYVKDANILISGDSLFQGGMGRCDLPGGDYSLMNNSLEKLKRLPKNTTVYPGHGYNTTIGDEFNL